MVKGEHGKQKTVGFDHSCFQCRHYRMQGCLEKQEGHPTIGRGCKAFDIRDENYSELVRG